MSEENIQTQTYHGSLGAACLRRWLEIRRALSFNVLFGGMRGGGGDIPDIVMSSDTQPSQVFALPKH